MSRTVTRTDWMAGIMFRLAKDNIPQHIQSDAELLIGSAPSGRGFGIWSMAYNERVFWMDEEELDRFVCTADFIGQAEWNRRVIKRIEDALADFYEPILIMRRAQVGE